MPWHVWHDPIELGLPQASLFGLKVNAHWHCRERPFPKNCKQTTFENTREDLQKWEKSFEFKHKTEGTYQLACFASLRFMGWDGTMGGNKVLKPIKNRTEQNKTKVPSLLSLHLSLCVLF